jgi:hypothetical protein
LRAAAACWRLRVAAPFLAAVERLAALAERVVAPLVRAERVVAGVLGLWSAMIILY